MFRIRSVAVIALAIAAFVATVGSPAAAQGPGTAATSLQQQIDDQLRTSPGGVQINSNQIAWKNGTVVMTFPDATQPRDSLRAPANCPSLYFCFWAAANFEGRRLQFSDCGVQDLGDYGFRNQTTSWQNTTADWIQVFQLDVIDDLLWQEAPRSRSANVGAADNDRADYFERVC